MTDDIKPALRAYVAESAILRAPGPLTDSTPLAVEGILDSLAVLELVLFLESRFGIEFSTKDLDRRRLASIERIEHLVREKIAKRESRDVTAGQSA